MKINTKDFLSILSPLQAIINPNHTVPILRSVKLDFQQDFLIATGENLEINCSNSLALKTSKPKSICVDFQMLLAATKVLSDVEISISFLKNCINIVHNKGSFKIPCFDSDIFPKTESTELDKKAVIDSRSFKSALKVANKFILDDDVDSMGSISISIGKKIYIRATDRHRLFEEKIKGKGDEENLLLSGKSSTSLFTLIEDSDDLEIRYSKNKVYFKFENSEITVIQQQGLFPIAMFSKVLDSSKLAKTLKVNSKDLLASLKRVSVLSSKEKIPVIRFDLGKKESLISCESMVSETNAEETLKAEFSEERTVGYNYKYLIEVLSIFDGEPDLLIGDNNLLFIKHKKKSGALSPYMLNKKNE